MRGRTNNWTYTKLLLHTLKDANTGCLFWLRGKGSGGYGKVRQNFKQWSVHRLVWQLHYGPISDDFVIRHSCNNASCINIDHLATGTQQDNIKDMVIAERQNRGSEQHLSKLKENDIPIIRYMLDNGMTAAHISEIYKVSRTVIYYIKWGKTWRHVS